MDGHGDAGCHPTGYVFSMTVRAKHYLSATVLGIILAGLAACQQEKAAPPPPVRIVRTITVEKQPQLPNASFTGYVETQDRAALSFRIGGRMAERTVGVGSTVRQGELVARL